MWRSLSICLLILFSELFRAQSPAVEFAKTSGSFFDKNSKILHFVTLKNSLYSSDSCFLYYSSSGDKGITWSEQKKIAPVVGCKKTDADDPSETLQVSCDQSTGEYKDRIYICWSDEKHGKKDKDVFLVYSDDRGEHWTEPILVTYHPNHKEQYAPVLSINKQNGEVNIFYFDKQNQVDSKFTDVYLAQSKNGGLKFEYYKLNNEAMPVKNSSLSLEEQSKGWKVVWQNGKNKPEYALVSDTSLKRYQKQTLVNEITMDRSFRFSEKVNFSFTSDAPVVLTAVLNKPLEPTYEKIVFKNRKFKAGQNVFELDTKKEGLPKGNYVLTLYLNNKNTYVWITE